MTSTRGIERISAVKFRGSTRKAVLDIDATKPFVLVYGENGTGKSTLVDAIDFVCNQAPGSIKEISSTVPGKHLPSLNCKPADVSVAITSDGKTWTAGMRGATITVSPDVETPCVHILRRSIILSLVTAKPADRFKALSRFIDVQGVEASEDMLPKAIRDVEASARSLTDEVDTCERRIQAAFAEERTTEEANLTPLEWARRRSQQDPQGLADLLRDLKAVTDLDNTVQILLGKRNELQQQLNAARSKLEEVRNSVKGAENLDPRVGLLLVDLLTKALEYLSAAPQTVECPVCLRAASAADLVATVKTSLADLPALAEASKQLGKCAQDIRTYEAGAATAYKDLAQRTHELALKLESLDAGLTKGLKVGRDMFPGVYAWSGDVSESVHAEMNRFLEAVGPLIERVQGEQGVVQKKQAQLSAIKRDYERLGQAKGEAATQIAVKNVLQQTLEAVRKARREFVQGILDAVADECDDLFRYIHDGEKIGGVRLILDENKRGSLDQIGEFEGAEDVVPQAYYSESHLDTLGFCLFLATTHHATKGNAIVVLDDVFTSVDIQHIERILDLLLRKSEEFNQLIFTTHQRRWLTFFETNRASKQKADLISLAPWSLEDGIRSGRPSTYVEQLQALLGAGVIHRRDISSTAGYVIESVLEQMTGCLGIEMKRNPRNKYTCAPLLQAMVKPSKKLVVSRTDGFGTADAGTKNVVVGQRTLESVVVALDKRLTDCRNTTGDHFNWESADVTDADVVDFGKDALFLAKTFTCQHCGGMATRDKGAETWCSCGRLKILKP